eukprot:TRINITY_DN2309_c0_g1_i1.p1 TRINITY_DN2309_c0_g1~~TRINITY_DN2309_c0_g1_i1.p1  ORF type:complete len:347 (-),score=92.35 TRINITY_DN2309_c0_g1_i1:407-1447(-)
MSLNLAKETKTGLLYVSFNQDYGCFACGTEKGFLIFNCEPLKERFRREFDGGIGIVEMLFRCNILALVGGGKNPKYPPHKVMIWDDYQNKCIAELEFRSDVKAVKLRRDRIIVVLEYKVYVYNFSDLQPLHQIETDSNPRGLCALSSSENIILACPGPKPGFVHVELYDKKQTKLIKAHDNSLSQIVLNSDGSRLATSSALGTLIRVFDTATGTKLRELRRGADKADIYCLSFNPSSSLLCVSSDKGTVHAYAITDDAAQGVQESPNRQSSLSFMKDILPTYFSSEWSFAQFRVPDSLKCICAFGPEKNTIIVVCSDGSFFKYIFDAKGGEAKQEGYCLFLKGDDE